MSRKDLGASHRLMTLSGSFRWGTTRFQSVQCLQLLRPLSNAEQQPLSDSLAYVFYLPWGFLSGVDGAPTPIEYLSVFTSPKIDHSKI